MVVNLTVHALDKYNFDKGKADVPTGTPDYINGRFASAGWAKEFISEVKRTITIDLDQEREDLSMDSDHVDISSKRSAQYGRPWEGEER